MGGITGISTTYNQDNYHGELFMATPTDTPLLSAAGGVGGGKQTKSTSFEWQAEDLRDPASRPRTEGADAPTAEARTRNNYENVVQVFQEKVSTSYTKMAATGQYKTTESAPWQSNDGEANPVTNEHDHQITLTLKQIARDLNYVFWHGKKVKPTSNATARETQGLLSAIAEYAPDNVMGGTVLDATTATDTVTDADHALSDGDKVVFVDKGAATNVRTDRAYYVVSAGAGTFKVSATQGGAAITLGTATVKYVEAATPLTVATFELLVATIFDNGGLTEGETNTVFVGTAQKRALTAAYAGEYAKANLFADSRTVGGVNMQRIITNYGEFNVATDRMLPPDALAVTSLDQIDPVLLEIPGKGVLFTEDLAKTGAAENTQIYGEIGLKYGNPLAHGVLRGLVI